MAAKLNLRAGQAPSALRLEAPGGDATITAAHQIPCQPIDDRLEPASSEGFTEWLGAGMAILDATGRVTEINELLSGWLGHSAPAIVGRPFWDLLSERAPEWDEPLA